MQEFTKKQIGGRSLGERLRIAREAAHIDIRTLALRTRIQEKYLFALENQGYATLPDPLYQRMFLRSIAAVLGVEPALFLEQHTLEVDQCFTAHRERERPPQGTSRFALLVGPRVLSVIFVSIAAFVGLGVLGLEIHHIIAPPSVELVKPSDGEVSAQASVTIAGKTEQGAELRINGDMVYLNPEGAFEEAINLHRGVNVIKISAKKTHSDERVLYRRVLWGGTAVRDGGGGASVAQRVNN